MSSPFAVLRGDCRELMAAMPECSIDAVVTDPPYDLLSVSRGGSGRSNPGTPGSPFARTLSSGGFMGLGWDATGVAFDPETWKLALRVLRPGGYLLAFGGTRTFHRMFCAIEDAGFELRDALMFLHGVGFPKSLRVGDGMGTALKPSFEPICLARKPLDGTTAQNLAKWGTGALNIDDCRLGDRGDDSVRRWPANALFDEPAAALLDAQAGARKSGAYSGHRNTDKFRGVYGAFRGTVAEKPRCASVGGASRFFYVAKPSRAERDFGVEHFEPRTAGEATVRKDGSDGLKSPRAGAGRTGGARNFHPTCKSVALMRYLVRLVTPASGVVLDPFAGSGTTGVAAILERKRFIGMEMTEEYVPLARARIQAAVDRGGELRDKTDPSRACDRHLTLVPGPGTPTEHGRADAQDEQEDDSPPGEGGRERGDADPVVRADGRADRGGGRDDGADGISLAERGVRAAPSLPESLDEAGRSQEGGGEMGLTVEQAKAGERVAMLAAVSAAWAAGGCVVAVGSRLPPEVLSALLAVLDKCDAQVVVGTPSEVDAPGGWSAIGAKLDGPVPGVEESLIENAPWRAAS